MHLIFYFLWRQITCISLYRRYLQRSEIDAKDKTVSENLLSIRSKKSGGRRRLSCPDSFSRKLRDNTVSRELTGISAITTGILNCFLLATLVKIEALSIAYNWNDTWLITVFFFQEDPISWMCICKIMRI